MDAFGHEAVDLTGAIIGEHRHLHLHDRLVVTHHRTCLGVSWRHEGYLPGCLGNKRQEETEIDLFGFEHTLCKAIAVVGEVTGQHSCKMHLLAFLGIAVYHMVGDALSQETQLAKRLIVGGLDETGYLSEIHPSGLGEGLHGIEHSMAGGTGAKNAHRHTAGSMKYKSIGITLTYSLSHLGDGIILDRDDIYVGIGADGVYIGGMGAVELISQTLGMICCAAENLHDILAGIVESQRELGGQIT